MEPGIGRRGQEIRNQMALEPWYTGRGGGCLLDLARVGELPSHLTRADELRQ